MYKVIDRAIGFVEQMDSEGLVAFTSYFYDENNDGETPRPNTVEECTKLLKSWNMNVIKEH